MNRSSRPSISAALAIALGLSFAPAGPASAQDRPSGAYLAASTALLGNDFAAAATYLEVVLGYDPQNPQLLENAIQVHLSLGDFQQAVQLAGQLEQIAHYSPTARLVLAVDMLDRGENASAIEALANEEDTIGPLVSSMLRAWAHLAEGRMSNMLDELDRLAEQPGLQVFGLYHQALALAFAGDFEGAEAILSGEAAGPLHLTRRGVIARIQILSQLQRNEDALSLVNEVFGNDQSPAISDMRSALTAGEVLPFDIITSPRDGMAEAFFDIATTLRGEARDSYTLLYARIAQHMRPDHIPALLQAASLLDALGQHELAVEVYAEVSADDPAYHLAQIGRAEALYSAGQPEAAIEVLESLSQSHASIASVHVALGDLLRRESEFDAASRAYDRAIERLGAPEPQHWAVYYTRGITHEREDRWEVAEADFRQALELNPDQPHVLNYLGYSLVERHEHLEEALEMIERAVEGEPESGYITDSLGWVLYRLGNFEEAVQHMERAVELLPTDPIVNDHLGDVYWVVGRHREARFQWRRALSFGPEEDEIERIRRKLEVGLDEVLREEGESDHPPAPTDAN